MDALLDDEDDEEEALHADNNPEGAIITAVWPLLRTLWMLLLRLARLDIRSGITSNWCGVVVEARVALTGEMAVVDDPLLCCPSCAVGGVVMSRGGGAGVPGRCNPPPP